MRSPIQTDSKLRFRLTANIFMQFGLAFLVQLRRGRDVFDSRILVQTSFFLGGGITSTGENLPSKFLAVGNLAGTVPSLNSAASVRSRRHASCQVLLALNRLGMTRATKRAAAGCCLCLGVRRSAASLQSLGLTMDPEPFRLHCLACCSPLVGPPTHKRRDYRTL